MALMIHLMTQQIMDIKKDAHSSMMHVTVVPLLSLNISATQPHTQELHNVRQHSQARHYAQMLQL